MKPLRLFLAGTAAAVCGFYISMSFSQVAPTAGPPVGIAGAYNSSPPTILTGQAGWVQIDNAGNLKVNVAVGGGTGGTSSTFGAAFPATGTAVGMSQGGNMVGFTGTANNLNVNCQVGCAGGTFNNNADAVATSATNGQAAAWNYVWNGATWDRAPGTTAGVTVRSPVAANFLTTVTQGTSPWVVSNGGTFPTQSAITAASGSFASGAIAAGAQVDLLTMRGTKAPGTAAANSILNGGVYTSAGITLTDGQQAALQFTSTGSLLVSGVGVAQGSTTSGQTLSPVGGAVTTAAPTYTTGQTNLLSLSTTGSLRSTLESAGPVAPGTAATKSNLSGGVYTAAGVTLTDGQQAAEQLSSSGARISVLSSQYPAGSTVYTATATGTTGATTATLAGAASLTTYLCGFSIRANATAAATGNATVTGVITATMNFTQWTAPNASGLGITEMIFTPCIPASAANTSIAVVSAAPGTGGVVSVTAWGYKNAL